MITPLSPEEVNRLLEEAVEEATNDWCDVYDIEMDIERRVHELSMGLEELRSRITDVERRPQPAGSEPWWIAEIRRLLHELRRPR